MNSPYTKHLDATMDHTTAVSVPTYHQAPAQMAPMVVQTGDSSGNKASIALVAIVLAAIAGIGGWAIGTGAGPSWNELRRYEALAGREGEIRGRDKGWTDGRTQGRTEMSFLAKYEQLRTQADAFNNGWKSGIGTGQLMGAAKIRGRYGYGGYGYGGYGGYGSRYGRGYGYGYGSYYGGRTGGAVASAQALANATGQPVDVVVN